MILPPINVLLPKDYWDILNISPINDNTQFSQEPITSLKDNEVFVFGSNIDGFHGAGSAGFAYTGKIGNQYRLGNPLLRAPKGTKGFWAVLGKSHGFQSGTHGKSYAICTILKPGLKRSMPLEEIRAQILKLYSLAIQFQELSFLVTKSGTFNKPSLNGYSLKENASCYFLL